MVNNDNGMRRRQLTRRQGLVLLGAGAVWIAAGRRGAAAAVDSAGGLPACIARPQQTEGPFFVDERLERSDIRSDLSGRVKPGVPLRLTFRVSRMAGASCAALAGAQVDVWHCDAAGIYSDVDGRPAHPGAAFLRGFQRTDPGGSARFVTIFPGWYRGRAVHVHFKIRTQRAAVAHEFTSQIYFDDALTERIVAAAPYASNGAPPMRNADDFIYRDGGRRLVVDAAPDDQGYTATFDIGLV